MGASAPQAQALVGETRAIWEDLSRRTEAVDRVEATVHEIAQLGQALGEAVVTQAAQIEQVYRDALVATRFVGMGNEQVRKTIGATRGGTWNLFAFLMCCTAAVLFFDWFHS